MAVEGWREESGGRRGRPPGRGSEGKSVKGKGGVGGRDRADDDDYDDVVEEEKEGE